MGLLPEILSNEGKPEVVEAPAFSLTKVLSSAAVVVTPIAAAVVDYIAKVDFKAQHVVALALGILGFLAIASAADVLARAIATAAQKKAEADHAGMARLVPFTPALAGLIAINEKVQDVSVLGAAYGDQPYFLVRSDKDVFSWVPTEKIEFAD